MFNIKTWFNFNTRFDIMVRNTLKRETCKRVLHENFFPELIPLSVFQLNFILINQIMNSHFQRDCEVVKKQKKL